MFTVCLCFAINITSEFITIFCMTSLSVLKSTRTERAREREKVQRKARRWQVWLTNSQLCVSENLQARWICNGVWGRQSHGHSSRKPSFQHNANLPYQNNTDATINQQRSQWDKEEKRSGTGFEEREALYIHLITVNEKHKQGVWCEQS